MDGEGQNGTGYTPGYDGFSGSYAAKRFFISSSDFRSAICSFKSSFSRSSVIIRLRSVFSSFAPLMAAPRVAAVIVILPVADLKDGEASAYGAWSHVSLPTRHVPPSIRVHFRPMEWQWKQTSVPVTLLSRLTGRSGSCSLMVSYTLLAGTIVYRNHQTWHTKKNQTKWSHWAMLLIFF